MPFESLLDIPPPCDAARPEPDPVVGEWLAGQACLVEAWIERLVAQGGDVRLIALLDQHAAFLREARAAAMPV